MPQSRVRRILLVSFLILAVALPGCQALGGLGGLIPGLGGNPFDLIAALLGSPVGGPWGIVLGLLGQAATAPQIEPFTTEFNGEPYPAAFLKAIIPSAISPLLTETQLATLSERPSYAALATDGLIYFTEKNTGKVKRFDPNAANPTIEEVLDLPVNSAGDRGLIGIAFTPSGVNPALMFLTYDRSTTSADTTAEAEALESRVSSFPFPSPMTSQETVLFTFTPRDPLSPIPFAVNGIGPCHVGPDQKLYFAHGDWNTRLGAQVPLQENPAGKIFRVNFDGTTPDDNPFGGQAMWNIGLRNCRAFGWDSNDDKMYVVDRGWLTGEEINESNGGDNMGFPLIVGSAGTDWESLISLIPLYRQPFLDFGQSKPLPEMTTIMVMRGGTYGDALEGNILYNQFNISGSGIVPLGAQASRIVRLAYDALNPIVLWGDVWVAPDGAGRIACFLQRGDGQIIVICESAIYRLNPPAP